MNNVASWIWVLIPLAAIGIAPFKMWLRMKEKQLDRTSELTAEKAAQHVTRVAELEQRVRVLERILTDGGIHTAAQIEALRDLPAPSPVSEKVR